MFMIAVKKTHIKFIFTCICVLLALFSNTGIILLLLLASFVFLPIRIQFLVLTATALFPIGLKGAIGLEELQLYTVFAPLMLIGIALRKKSFIFSPKTQTTRFVWFGLLLLFSALVVSYLRNPAGARSLFGGIGGSYGLKNYYNGIMCLIIYFLAYFSVRRSLVPAHQLMLFILVLSIVIGTLRVMTYLGYFDIPLFVGSLDYLRLSSNNISNFLLRPRRIGGMDFVAGFSVVPAFILIEMKKYRKMALAGIILGIFFLVLSGGRSSFIGVSAAMLVGLTKSGVRRFAQVFLVILGSYLILSNVSFGSQHTITESQLTRIFRYEAVIERQVYRVEGYTQLLEAFKENPLFGKGISPVSYEERGQIADYGGHGSYFSLIGLFGTFGIGFIIFSIIVPLIKGLKISLSSYNENHKVGSRNILYYTRFATLALVFLTIILGVAYSGYQSPYLFYFIGVLTAQFDTRKLYIK